MLESAGGILIILAVGVVNAVLKTLDVGLSSLDGEAVLNAAEECILTPVAPVADIREEHLVRPAVLELRDGHTP